MLCKNHSELAIVVFIDTVLLKRSARLVSNRLRSKTTLFSSDMTDTVMISSGMLLNLFYCMLCLCVSPLVQIFYYVFC